MEDVTGLCEKRGPRFLSVGSSTDRDVAKITRSPWLLGRLPAWVVLALAVACGSPGADATVERRVPQVSAVDSQRSALRAVALPPRDSVSAHAPTWDVNLAVGALRSSGMRPVVQGTVQESFFGVAGTLVKITGAELELFVYGDAIAAAHDIDGLDTLTVSPRGRRVVWRKPPALVTSNNLVTIVLTADPAVRKQVRAVLGTIGDGPHPAPSP